MRKNRRLASGWAERSSIDGPGRHGSTTSSVNNSICGARIGGHGGRLGLAGCLNSQDVPEPSLAVATRSACEGEPVNYFGLDAERVVAPREAGSDWGFIAQYLVHHEATSVILRERTRRGVSADVLVQHWATDVRFRSTFWTRRNSIVDATWCTELGRLYAGFDRRFAPDYGRGMA